MLTSTMLNLFRWALTPQCPEIILDTVVISFLSALHSSNHGIRETLGKDGVRKPSCFSDFPTFLPFVQHSLFRDWN
jgi:hypothetical protein